MATEAFCAGQLAVRGSGFGGDRLSITLLLLPAPAGFWVCPKRGCIALTPQPFVGSRSIALGLALNPVTKVIPKGKRKEKESSAPCALAELGTAPRQALHRVAARNGATVCADRPEGNFLGGSQPDPLQGPPVGAGRGVMSPHASGEHHGRCLSPHPDF